VVHDEETNMRMFPMLVAACLVSGGVMAQTTTAPAAPTAAVALPPTTATHTALTEEQIKSNIASAGFKEVKGLEFKDGVWRTEARGGNDNWVDLLVGPVNGKVYSAEAPSQLNEDEVTARLTAAGYGRIHGVKFDDGLWRARAIDAQGVPVLLLADPDDGSVVSEERSRVR
jgi:hypothetical protein